MRPIVGDQISSSRATSLPPCSGRLALQYLAAPLFLLSSAGSQCVGIATTPQSAADCAAHAVPQGTVAPLDSDHTYSLAELIDLAERNNPRTRIAWREPANAPTNSASQRVRTIQSWPVRRPLPINASSIPSRNLWPRAAT